MNGLPFPVDANGVHYYDNADANGYLAMPVEQKILDSGGNFVSVSKTNPQPTSDVVTQTTLDSIDAVLNTLNVLITAIKSTDGIKKITDALPPGTNLLGKTIPVDTDGNEKFTSVNPGNMQLIGRSLAIAGSKTVTTHGNPELLAVNQFCGKGVIIEAMNTNTGNIYIFPVNGVKTDVQPLMPWDVVTWPVSNLNALKIDSDINGEGVYWRGVV